jgi:Do/DeqQ family serine protease
MKRNIAVIALAAALGGSAVTYHVTREPEAPNYVFAQSGINSLTFAPMLRKATPAVVNVTSEVRPQRTSSQNRNRRPGRGGQQLPPGFEDFFRGFGFGGPDFEMPERRRGGGVGSGVIVTPDGYILTNNHVGEGADRVTVSLSDRRELIAKVVGTDPLTDIAVLKVDVGGLPSLPISDSAKVQVGDLALAIGNPFGIGQTVTMGIIGATGRAGLHPGNYEDFIQTDAAINPGNSGGALVTSTGHLIGINTAIISSGGGNQGIGFAIPINMAREVMDQLVKTGKVVRGYMGAGIQEVTPELARAFNLKSPSGAAITRVEPGSPAEKAGLQSGDVVTAVNGEAVADHNALRLRISRTAPGTTVRLTVNREGKEMQLPVTLGTLPTDDEGRPATGDFGPGARSPLEGVSVDDITPELSRQLRLPPNVTGVIVTEVDPTSPAAEAGLRRGDVIVQVNRQRVTSVREFEAEVRRAGRGTVLLLVNTNGVNRFVPIEPETR